MKLIRKALLLFSASCLFFTTCLDANARYRSQAPQPTYNANTLNAEINRIIASVNPDLNLGIQIKSMRTGATLYSRNAHRSFVPASILKVFTAESALLFLGADYKFATFFATDASSINSGVLNGNLYLIHSGDPSLTYFDLTDLMSALKAKNIREITGNVYIDTSAYDQEIYGPGWVSNDTRFCYAAPISASIINHNCMVLQVSPSKTVGRSATITGDKQHFISGVQNDVVTKPRGTRSCYLRLGTSSERGIVLSGCMPKGKYTQGVSAVVNNIVHYNKSLMDSLFQRYGIRVNGNILPGSAENSTSTIAMHHSKPLRDLISEMLKKSDNIIAGSLFKKIGEVYTQRPGSWENGSAAVTQILKQKIGVDTWNMNVLDGSGLSRNNLITPAQMMQVLDFAYHNQATSYDFLNALPIAGVDGTLKHRMQNIRGKVRAKTGTMSGVVALAGYAMTRNQQALAFVIIINGRMGMGWKYKEMENRIMTALTNYTGN